MSSDVTSVIDPVEKPRAAVPTKGTARSFWIKQFYVWHWVSGAFALAAMIFFAGTGITLNHAANFSAKPRVTRTQTKLPAHLLAKIATDTGGAEKARQVVPVEVRDWLRTELDSDPGARKVEWTADEIYIDLPGRAETAG